MAQEYSFWHVHAAQKTGGARLVIKMVSRGSAQKAKQKSSSAFKFLVSRSRVFP